MHPQSTSETESTNFRLYAFNILTLSYSSCDANRSRCIRVIYRTSVSGRASSRLSNFSWEIPFEARNWTMWLGIPRLAGLTYRICTLYRVSNLTTRTNTTLSISLQSSSATVSWPVTACETTCHLLWVYSTAKSKKYLSCLRMSCTGHVAHTGGKDKCRWGFDGEGGSNETLWKT